MTALNWESKPRLCMRLLYPFSSYFFYLVDGFDFKAKFGINRLDRSRSNLEKVVSNYIDSHLFQ